MLNTLFNNSYNFMEIYFPFLLCSTPSRFLRACKLGITHTVQELENDYQHLREEGLHLAIENKRFTIIWNFLYRDSDIFTLSTLLPFSKDEETTNYLLHIFKSKLLRACQIHDLKSVRVLTEGLDTIRNLSYLDDILYDCLFLTIDTKNQDIFQILLNLRYDNVGEEKVKDKKGVDGLLVKACKLDLRLICEMILKKGGNPRLGFKNASSENIRKIMIKSFS